MKTNTSLKPRTPRGFALIASLTLLSLLAIIATGVLSLSALEARRAGLGKAQDEARANARLALMTALAELQKTLGPDQAISAPAGVGRLDRNDIRPLDSTTLGSRDFLKNYFGAWRAAENPRLADGEVRPIEAEESEKYPLYAEEGKFEPRESSPFKRWLFSHPDPDFVTNESLFDSPDATVETLFPISPTNSESVKLVGSGSSLTDIRAGLININEDAVKGSGKFAWWVSDNNTKAFIAAKDIKSRKSDDPSSDSELKDHPLTGFGVPGAHGLETLDDLNLIANTESTDRILTIPQTLLASPTTNADSLKKYYHDLTANADSLLVNVTSGGTRKDLSLFFDGDPTDGSWKGYQQENTLAEGPYGKIALSDHLNYDTGNWSLMRQHYALHRTVRYRSAWDKFIDKNPIVKAPDATNPNIADSAFPSWNTPRKSLNPVISRFSFALSVGVQNLNNADKFFTPHIPNLDPHYRTKKPDLMNNKYVMTFHAYPVVTLWNPYNVAISSPGMAIETTGTSVEQTIQFASTPAPGPANPKPVPETKFNWSQHRLDWDRAGAPDPMGFNSFSFPMTLVTGSFDLEPGETVTFWGTEDVKYERASMWMRVAIAPDTNSISLAKNPNNVFSHGFVFNSVRSETISGLDNDAETWPAHARIRGLFLDQTDIVNISTNLFIPQGTRAQDNDTNPHNGHQGLLSVDEYASLGLRATSGNFNPSQNGRQLKQAIQGAFDEKGASRSSGAIAWRNDIGNPVVIQNKDALIREDIRIAGPSATTLEKEKQILMMVDMHLKPTTVANITDTTLNPSAPYLHSIPSHGFLGVDDRAVEGAGPKEIIQAANSRAYTINYYPLANNAAFWGLLQVNEEPNKLVTYGGSSYGPTGQLRMVTDSIPLAPMQSLGELQHVQQTPMDASRISGLGLQNYAIGNSYANPLIEPDAIANISREPDAPTGSYPGWKATLNPFINSAIPDYEGNSWNSLVPAERDKKENVFVPVRIIDRSWVANTLLWDDFYFSGICSYDGPYYNRGLGGTRKTLSTAITSFVESDGELPNSRYIYTQGETPEKDVKEELASAEGFRKAANYITVKGGFNINSLSVPAWKAFLASNLKKRQAIIDAQGKALESSDFPESELEQDQEDSAEYIISRHQVSNQKPSNSSGDSEDNFSWIGFNTVSENQLDDLAEKIVEEVAARGPFRSIAQFINRRVEKPNTSTSSDPDNPDPVLDFTVKGTLQAAIDKSIINEGRSGPITNLNEPKINVVSNLYPHQRAAEQSIHAGTPPYIMQADLLQMLGPVIQARGDTFTIRAYGESSNGSAKAWCEAIVTRTIELVDDNLTDLPEMTQDELTSEINKTFGRKFKIISFKWLSADEV